MGTNFEETPFICALFRPRDLPPWEHPALYLSHPHTTSLSLQLAACLSPTLSSYACISLRLFFSLSLPSLASPVLCLYISLTVFCFACPSPPTHSTCLLSPPLCLFPSHFFLSCHLFISASRLSFSLSLSLALYL